MSDGIHTCHDKCPRLACVQRREIERLTAEVEALRADARRFDWLTERLEDCSVDGADPLEHYTEDHDYDDEPTPYPVLWRRAIDAAIDRARGT